MTDIIPENITLEDKPCPMGCPSDDEVYLKGNDRIHHLPGTFTVVRCRKCQLLRTNPRPTPDTMGFYYPDHYGPYVGSQVSPTDIKAEKKNKTVRHIIDQCFRTFTRSVPKMPPGRMLEIGCASGNYLQQMSSLGWEAEGIEFSSSAAEAAKKIGFPIHVGSIESIEAPQHQFDLITGWMVLEHMHEPVQALRRLASWLNPGGWLALSTPNVSTFWHERVKDAAFDLQVPTHLYHFTPETIEALLDAGGWDLKRILHQKTLRTIMPTIAFCLEDRFGKDKALVKWFYHYRFKGLFWQLAVYPMALLAGLTGNSGRMTIWAQKKS